MKNPTINVWQVEPYHFLGTYSGWYEVWRTKENGKREQMKGRFITREEAERAISEAEAK